MEYDAHCSLIGCTRPLDDEVEEALEQSGLRSRFYHSPWDANEEGIEAIRKMGGPKYDPEDMLALQDINTKLFLTEFTEMPHPPHDAFREVYAEYQNEVEDLVNIVGLKPSQIYDGRDFMTTKQFLTGAAVERTVRKLPDGPFGTANTVHEIEYRDEDIEVAKYFARQYGMTKFRLFLRDVKTSREEMQDVQNLRIIVEEWGDIDEIIPVAWLRDLGAEQMVTHHSTPMSNKKTFYNFLNRCMEEGWIVRVKQGEYKITERGERIALDIDKVSVDDALDGFDPDDLDDEDFGTDVI